MPTAHVCRYLRWKGFKQAMSPEEREAAFGKNQVPYTCLHTGQPWGPTDEPAAPERCGASRACFVAKDRDADK
jgi:hypothetical protein